MEELVKACPSDVDIEEVEEEFEIGVKRDISGDAGVFKELITPGTGFEQPEKGDQVTVHYVGTLESDGTQFDSSRDRNEPFTFSLGTGSVIKGWDVGVATMKKGERSKLYIRSDYGYGDSGSPPSIPGGATLVFDVELISWKSVKDICGDGGIIRTVVQEGEGYGSPASKDEVTIQVTMAVANQNSSDGSNTTMSTAAPFYSTPEEGVEFYLKEGPTSFPWWCKALEIVLPKMKQGEKSRLVVQPEYAFGVDGRSDLVPSNATLMIDVTMVGWKKVENVTMDGLVWKKTLVDTTEWQRPNEGATVTVSYTGRLPDGTVFDEKTDFSFTTEEEQAPCEGFDLAVLKMKKLETALVTIDPKFAFGEAGTSSVPGNTTVTYEIKLSDFVKAPESWDLEAPEKIKTAMEIKEKGNAAFKAGKTDRAAKLWERAFRFIEFDDSFDAEQKKDTAVLKKSIDLNLAAAYLKINRPLDARKSATKVLDKESTNMKALYRRAQSYIATSDWIEAERDIKNGLTMEPDNNDFTTLLKVLKKKSAAATKKEAALWSAAFK